MGVQCQSRVSNVLLSFCSIKIEKEIKEMRESYAKKKSDMLEKTRLVRTSLHVHCWLEFTILMTMIIIPVPYHLVQKRGRACCR
jgi:hypothetical protein